MDMKVKIIEEPKKGMFQGKILDKRFLRFLDYKSAIVLSFDYYLCFYNALLSLSMKSTNYGIWLGTSISIEFLVQKTNSENKFQESALWKLQKVFQESAL